jgi:hypothetical protein
MRIKVGSVRALYNGVIVTAKANVNALAQPTTTGALQQSEPDAQSSFIDALTAAGNASGSASKKPRFSTDDDDSVEGKDGKSAKPSEQSAVLLPATLPYLGDMLVPVAVIPNAMLPERSADTDKAVTEITTGSDSMLQQTPQGDASTLNRGDVTAEALNPVVATVDPTAATKISSEIEQAHPAAPDRNNVLPPQPGQALPTASGVHVKKDQPLNVEAPKEPGKETAPTSSPQSLTIPEGTTLTSLVADTTNLVRRPIAATPVSGVKEPSRGGLGIHDPLTPRNEGNNAPIAVTASDAATNNTKIVQSTQKHGVEAATDKQDDDSGVPQKTHGMDEPVTPAAGMAAHAPSFDGGARAEAKDVSSPVLSSASGPEQAPTKSDAGTTAPPTSVPWQGEQPSALGVASARLAQNIQQSGMRVGLQSKEFGAISIHSVASAQGQISSEITLGHSGLADLIGAHIEESQNKVPYSQMLSVRVDTSGSVGGSSGGLSQGTSGNHPQEDSSQRRAAQRNDNSVGWAGPFQASAVPVSAGQTGRLDVRG